VAVEATTHNDVILEFLESFPKGCCDDCISQKTGIAPRQQVNQICRRLEQQGKVIRRRGPCELGGHIKILNILANTATEPRTTRIPPPERISIEDLRNRLDRFCKALAAKHKVGEGNAGLARLIGALSDASVISVHQANMMHVVRVLRNAYVHDHIRIGHREETIASLAWEILSEWAESCEPELWKMANH
jgi:Domain of unknown function (DUF4145)